MTGVRLVDDLGTRCVAALRDGAEGEAREAFALILDQPEADVVSWLANAVLAASAGVPDEELANVVGAAIEGRGIVAETVAALRAEDSGRLLAVAGYDIVDLVVHLAAVVATLDDWAL